MVGSKVMDSLSWYSGRVGDIARPEVVSMEERLHSTASKTTSANSFKPLSNIQQSDLKLWSFCAGTRVMWWYRPTGHRRRGGAIPCYFMENNLRKLMKTFERDPTVGSKVMDLLSWYSGRVRGIA